MRISVCLRGGGEDVGERERERRKRRKRRRGRRNDEKRTC
jgi:hypothetical protein